jgi:hypothetical protein
MLSNILYPTFIALYLDFGASLKIVLYNSGIFGQVQKEPNLKGLNAV